jgi:ferredoxin
MIRQINEGELHEALITVKQHIALPAVLGRICPELCEKGCRRGQIDSPVSICRLKRYVADVDLATWKAWLPEKHEDSGKYVAIVGSGPAGLAAAWYLLQLGHACTLFDEHEEPGGNLRYAVGPARLPRDVLDAEIALVRRLGAKFEYPVQIGKTMSVAELTQQYDAVLLAVGEVDAAKAKALDVPMLGKGLKTDKRTMLTPTPGVFATGAAVTPYRHAVRAVGDGRTAAASIDAFLRGHAPVSESQFTVRLGVLSEAELAVFRSEATGDDRAQPPLLGLSDVQASTESARCFQCQCAKQSTCSLRKYSVAYDASPSEFKLERRRFTRVSNHAAVIYEQGKCISCGLCVQIASRAAEPLGLTFIGRGFDVRIGVPFDHTLSEALQATAEECARVCPTGALALRERPKESST